MSIEVWQQVFPKFWSAAEEWDKPLIKGQRYNLFRNPENLKPKQKALLEKLLAMKKNWGQICHCHISE